MRQDTLDILSSDVVAVKGAKISNLEPDVCGVHLPKVAAQFQMACGQTWYGYIKEEDYTFVPASKGNQLKDIVQIGWKKERLYPLCTMMANCQVKPECEQTDSVAYEHYLNFNSVPLFKLAKKIDTKLQQLSACKYAESKEALKRATIDLKRVLALNLSKERV